MDEHPDAEIGEPLLAFREIARFVFFSLSSGPHREAHAYVTNQNQRPIQNGNHHEASNLLDAVKFSSSMGIRFDVIKADSAAEGSSSPVTIRTIGFAADCG
jgi:hypothetical protein